MTIGFAQTSHEVVEGERGVSLVVEVRAGEIPVGQIVEVTLSTADGSATGVLFLEFCVDHAKPIYLMSMTDCETVCSYPADGVLHL